ncbi:hypothetical protein BO71DRAFT_153399 [Aspergillus ellipticus CBS 707.79]|uniref:Uncharacterized protein n=1 Tax=Aspergillus ellipticus CBS 707.79 TaxID=1448320 RepID=A0A319CU89_9EURO|nr:hypothetical protein BO71DRAFT_153399 [Aspergillus ellipticus CBS 707.79]
MLRSILQSFIYQFIRSHNPTQHITDQTPRPTLFLITICHQHQRIQSILNYPDTPYATNNIPNPCPYNPTTNNPPPPFLSTLSTEAILTTSITLSKLLKNNIPPNQTKHDITPNFNFPGPSIRGSSKHHPPPPKPGSSPTESLSRTKYTKSTPTMQVLILRGMGMGILW